MMLVRSLVMLMTPVMRLMMVRKMTITAPHLVLLATMVLESENVIPMTVPLPMLEAKKSDPIHFTISPTLLMIRSILKNTRAITSQERARWSSVPEH